jgi:hypothetical protein
MKLVDVVESKECFSGELRLNAAHSPHTTLMYVGHPTEIQDRIKIFYQSLVEKQTLAFIDIEEKKDTAK